MPDDLWTQERRFWIEGAEEYRRHMDPGCVMVFAGRGILMGPDILAALRDAERWREVSFTGQTLYHSDDVAVLAYFATAVKAAGDYRAACSSTYHRSDTGAWALVSHHQSPLA
ncbi:DUF4440 domain-containing protein [Celeribacter indicus]|uniref:DUF4440 domain-containing protein n=1 Tax=Celeribacter indicus TaxID=1208324 RepID=A0A0B5E4S0_9RHOB|nr:DUF4440 domain-containing protein [Celeribacter indicus]AJE48350.1 hypothetical protein P73_3635 [Celeribacter indicus]SDW73558.1 protein of unknown function [Celeribacter indicus]